MKKNVNQEDLYLIKFEPSLLNERKTRNELGCCHFSNDDPRNVSYISDLHLEHRIANKKSLTKKDAMKAIDEYANQIIRESTNINLIGGDTSHDFSIFNFFIKRLNFHLNKSDNEASKVRKHFFLVLGNHELWNFEGQSFDAIIEKYRNLLKKVNIKQFHLVENNLYWMNTKKQWIEISNAELKNLSIKKLRGRLRTAKIAIFGGIGFSGQNEIFNANDGIYRNTITRDEEIQASNQFLLMYDKIIKALYDKNLIVLTHMPKEDWGGKAFKNADSIIYVSGHTHRNVFENDGKIRNFSDNQVGYEGKSFSLKYLEISYSYDYFSDYKDGKYDIGKLEYLKFARGMGNEVMQFNSTFKTIKMIKRCGFYMFFMENEKGKIYLLNGGQKLLSKHNYNYYYDNLKKYSEIIKQAYLDYGLYQKKVSSFIKNIGGIGTIHGCIVDIDRLNHLYVNPLDGKITAYNATDMVDKYVYDNLASLLYNKCSLLYEKYRNFLCLNYDYNYLPSLIGKDDLISAHKIHEKATDIYRISRLVKSLQYLTKYNVVRNWNDDIIEKAKTGDKKAATILLENLISQK